MDIMFRTVSHITEEIAMGQTYWFKRIPECDAISVSANSNGFTPLMSITREFDWDRDLITKAAESCNEKAEVCVVPMSPTLFLVPTTKGHGDTHFLINDLISATRAAHTKALHFSHFGFIQGHLPVSEVISVLDYLLGNSTTLGLKLIVIDIDVRVEAQFYELLRPITLSRSPVVQIDNKDRLMRTLGHKLVAKLRKHYKPKKIKFLFVAESPPDSTEEEVRFFYNPNQESFDHMYRSVMRCVFPKYEYRPGEKAEWLTKFMKQGYYMIDATDIPVNRLTPAKRNCVLRDSVKEKIAEIGKLVTKKTPIILVKQNVFEIFNAPLRNAGFNVIHDEFLPFPSHGHQARFIAACKRCLHML